LQSGSLVTPGPGPFFENNVAVGSDQWNAELGQGTKPYGGLVGAAVAALVPGMCGMAAVCAIRNRTQRTVATVGVSAAYSSSLDPGSELSQAIRFFWGGCAGVADDVAAIQGLGSLAYGVYNLVAGNDIATLTDAHARGIDKFLAAVDLASNALVFVPIVGEGTEAAKLAEATSKAEVELHGATDVEAHVLTFSEADTLVLRSEGCSCFPGATGVLTPHGLVAIASLQAGDQVLTEDPNTGKVEP